MSHFIHNDMTISYRGLFPSVFDSARKVLSIRDQLPGHETHGFSGILQRIEDEAYEKVRNYNSNLELLRDSMLENPRYVPESKLARFLALTGLEGRECIRELEEDIADDVEETIQEVESLMEESRVVAIRCMISRPDPPPGDQGSQAETGRPVEEWISSQRA